jgi:hypothetical protein
MMNITLPENLLAPVSSDRRTAISSDETWAFTEMRRSSDFIDDRQKLNAHDLFILFTADIIRQKTTFTR